MNDPALTPDVNVAWSVLLAAAKLIAAPLDLEKAPNASVEGTSEFIATLQAPDAAERLPADSLLEAPFKTIHPVFKVIGAPEIRLPFTPEVLSSLSVA